MLPRWHIIYGAIFTAFLWIAIPSITKLSLLLVFLSSVFIDLDHYFCAVLRTKKIGLIDAFRYHDRLEREEREEREKGIRRKGDFHIFHTIEFHIIVAALSLLWSPFWYIFIGMTYHSILDIGTLINDDYLYRREYLLLRHIKKRFKIR